MARSGEGLATDQQEFSVGRGGLKIPTIEWRDGYGTSNVFDLFRNFWALNSDRPSHNFYDGYGRFMSNTLSGGKMKVVPAEDSKPTLIIRGDFHNQMRDQQEETPSGLFDHRTVQVWHGIETHAILTMPDTTADDFTELASITSDDSRHSSSTDLRVAGVEVYKKSQSEYMDPLRDGLGNLPDDWPEITTRMVDEDYEARTRAALEQIVGLLT